MAQDFSVETPNRRLDRVRADFQERDGSYRMPRNHDHPYFELYYIESGKCRFFVSGRMMDMQAGDLLLIPPRAVHYTRYLFGPCLRYSLFFRPQDLEREISGVFPDKGNYFRRWRLMQIPEFYREALVSLLKRIVGEERINDEKTPLLMRCRLQELLLICSRVGLQTEELPGDIHTTDRAVVRAAEFMRDHFREELSAEEIAAAAGFSQNYFSQKFRQATGTGIHEYLTYVRLQQAALELLETRDSVTEIALRCGFSGGNYFKDVFRKRYGVSPRAYRSGAAALSEQEGR